VFVTPPAAVTADSQVAEGRHPVRPGFDRTSTLVRAVWLEYAAGTVPTKEFTDMFMVRIQRQEL